MPKVVEIFGNIIEFLGLDWFTLLCGKQPFEDGPSPYPNDIEEIDHRFGDIEGDKLEDALKFTQGLVEREHERLQTIESKAFTVIGIASGATGFLGWFISLVFERDSFISGWDRLAIIMLYIFVVACVISLIMTINLATHVVKLRGYRFTSPLASDIFELKETPLKYVKKQRTVSLFYSFVRNQLEVNRKGTYLRGSYTWLRNSIALLLVVIVFVALYLPMKWGAISITQTPTPTLTATLTILPTHTLSPSPTLAVPKATVTSTSTSTPIPPPTLTPIPTIVPTIAVTPTQVSNP